MGVGAVAVGPSSGDTEVMRMSLRLACLIATALSIGIPGIATACLPPPRPAPPPRTSGETEAEFSARSAKWYRDINEREWKEALPGMAAREDRLWASAARVVLARVTKVGSTRFRGSENQWVDSPLVTLRPVKWLKGNSKAKRLRVRYLSDDSCDQGGGDAPDGEVGDRILLFYRPGMLIPENVLDTLSEDRGLTRRSRDAFGLAATDQDGP